MSTMASAAVPMSARVRHGLAPMPRPARIAVAATVVVVLALSGIRGLDGSPDLPVGEAVTLPASEVEELGRDRPLYWAGEQGGTKLEVTRGAQGEMWLRYLTGSATAGDERARYLTIGTYPVPDAHAAASKASEGSGMRSSKAAGGGLVTWSERSPSNVYITERGADTLVEVYSPDGAQARRLALSGAVVPAR